MERNKVILVDEFDTPTGETDKIEAHIKGMLHRAFSVFIFNTYGELLLQQRSSSKYHGAGLWTNTCCSHPQPGEDTLSAAIERLNFEMGLQCDLIEIFSFVYHAPVENSLTEHEFDHVFVGYTDSEPIPHPEEVQNYRWVHPEKLMVEITENPEIFTFWFKKSINQVISALKHGLPDSETDKKK